MDGAFTFTHLRKKKNHAAKLNFPHGWKAQVLCTLPVASSDMASRMLSNNKHQASSVSSAFVSSSSSTTAQQGTKRPLEPVKEKENKPAKKSKPAKSKGAAAGKKMKKGKDLTNTLMSSFFKSK